MRTLRSFFPCLAQTRDQVITALGHEPDEDSAPLVKHIEIADVQVDVSADGQTIELNDRSTFSATSVSDHFSAAPTHVSKSCSADDDGYQIFQSPINGSVNAADPKVTPDDDDHRTENTVPATESLEKAGGAGLRRVVVSPVCTAAKHISPVGATMPQTLGLDSIGRISLERMTDRQQPGRRLFDVNDEDTTEWSSKTVATPPKKLLSPTSVMDIPTVTPTSSCFGERDETEENIMPVLPQDQLSSTQSDESEEEVAPAARSLAQLATSSRVRRRVHHLRDGFGDRKRGYVLLDEENEDMDQILEKTNVISPETRSFVRRVKAEERERNSSPLFQQITTPQEKKTRMAKYKETHDGLLSVVCQVSQRCVDLQSSMDEKNGEVAKLKTSHKRLAKSLKAAKKRDARNQRAIARTVLAANTRRDQEQKEMEEVVEKLLKANNKLETALQAMKAVADSAHASLNEMTSKRKIELNESRERHQSLDSEHRKAHSRVFHDMEKLISEIEELKQTKHDLEHELECAHEMLDQEAAKRGQEALSHVYEVMDLSRDYDARVALLREQHAKLEEQNEAQKLQIDELKMSLELMGADADYASKKFERTTRKYRHEIRSLTKDSDERFFEVMVARGEECEDMRLSLQGMFDVEKKAEGGLTGEI